MLDPLPLFINFQNNESGLYHAFLLGLFGGLKDHSIIFHFRVVIIYLGSFNMVSFL